MLRFAALVAAAAFALAALCPGQARAAADAPAAIVLPELSEAPPLDGTLRGAWTGAVRVQLGWDFANRRPASDPTTAYLGRFGDALYVAFDAVQRAPLTATQRTDGSGVDGDDGVRIDLWPNGPQGFAYWFESNPLGARDQYSSENTAYAPAWTAGARRADGGYVVTMRIPLGVMRGGAGDGWRVQLQRATVARGATDVWRYDGRMQRSDDVVYAGLLTMPPRAVAKRPQPRLQLYALDQAATAAAGGTTSRLGADLSVPLTATSSFVATLHPDYSNVEVDQQTIAPTEFQRQYAEVRPFFTQGAQLYNQFSCISCPMQTLYTPAIPALRTGYAVEGTQGPLSFGAFDAVGDRRSDVATSLAYNNAQRTLHFAAQRVAVNAFGLRDDVTEVGGFWQNPHSHLALSLNHADDRGTNVTDPSRAKYDDVAVSIGSQTSFLGIALRRLGAQFIPADGYVQLPDIAGYAANGSKTFTFSPKAALRMLQISGSVDRYHDHTGAVDQSDGSASVAAIFRNQLALSVFSDASWAQTSIGQFLPFDQNGFGIGYRTNTSTPTNLTYAGGPYYHGAISTWQRSTAFGLGARLLLNLEVDDTRYASRAAGESSTTQWLERAALTYQLSREASFSLGARRIVGVAPPTAYALPAPFGLDAGNVSAAFHILRGHDELYAAYGDPNVLATKPAIVVKLIHYFGAGRGT